MTRRAPRGPARRLAIAAALILGGCAEDPGEGRAAVGPVAPALLRGAVSLEPPRIQIGDVADLEIAIATPPDHRVRPLELPDEVPGFWILDRAALPLEREAGRLLHRTRVRIRAHSVGHSEWPPLRAEIEGPDGARHALSVEGRPLEVVSVLAEFPDRSAPFGLRPLAGAPTRHGVLLPGAVGAALALGCVGLVVLVRRARRRTPGVDLASLRPSVSPEFEADAALAAALARVDADPRAAANAAARALRRFAARRFRVARAASRSTEELATEAPPVDVARWRALLLALRALDATRFRRAGTRSEPLRAVLADTRASLSASHPVKSDRGKPDPGTPGA